MHRILTDLKFIRIIYILASWLLNTQRDFRLLLLQQKFWKSQDSLCESSKYHRIPVTALRLHTVVSLFRSYSIIYLWLSAEQRAQVACSCSVVLFRCLLFTCFFCISSGTHVFMNALTWAVNVVVNPQKLPHRSRWRIRELHSWSLSASTGHFSFGLFHQHELFKRAALRDYRFPI